MSTHQPNPLMTNQSYAQQRPQLRLHRNEGGSSHRDARHPMDRGADRHSDGAEKKKFVAKGHDAQLQAAQYDQAEVEVCTLSDIVFRGTISRRDRYTLTIKDSSGVEVIVFKSAVESIRIKKATPAANEATDEA